MTNRRNFAAASTLAIALLVLVLVSGCDGLFQREKVGIVALHIDAAQMSARSTYVPDDSSVAAFRVRGFSQGEDGLTIDQTEDSANSDITLEAVPVGPWAFHVDALNSTDVPILSGSATVEIVPGETTQTAILLSPITGEGREGTLRLQLRWPTTTLSSPSVNAQLSRYVDGSFGPDEELAPFESAEGEGVTAHSYEGIHAAGYYTIVTEIIEDGFAIQSKAVTARILNGLRTEVSIDLETGDVEVVISLNPENPLSVALTAESGTVVTQGEAVTVTSAVTGGTPPYTYRWYMNGTRIASRTGPSITYGETLGPGRYTLSLVASDGTVLGSEWIAWMVVQ